MIKIVPKVVNISREGVKIVSEKFPSGRTIWAHSRFFHRRAAALCQNRINVFLNLARLKFFWLRNGTIALLMDIDRQQQKHQQHEKLTF